MGDVAYEPMPLSDYVDVHRTYEFSSSKTLGASFIQDIEQGPAAGVCVADVTPGGMADQVGVVAGMMVFGVHGKPTEGKSFHGALVHTAHRRDRGM